jgi:hypothetical protein
VTSSLRQAELVDEELIPTEIAVCTACGGPIDLSRRHVTLNLSVERQDAEGNIRYGGVRVLGRWHPLHATWEPTPQDRGLRR